MDYGELCGLILLRGETLPATPPPEFRGSTFKTEGHAYVCSSEGLIVVTGGWNTRWSWNTWYAIETEKT